MRIRINTVTYFSQTLKVIVTTESFYKLQLKIILQIDYVLHSMFYGTLCQRS